MLTWTPFVVTRSEGSGGGRGNMYKPVRGRRAGFSARGKPRSTLTRYRFWWDGSKTSGRTDRGRTRSELSGQCSEHGALHDQYIQVKYLKSGFTHCYSVGYIVKLHLIYKSAGDYTVSTALMLVCSPFPRSPAANPAVILGVYLP